MNASSVAAMSPSIDGCAGWWRFRQWPGRLFDVGVVVALLAVGAVIVVTSTNEIPRLSAARLPLYFVILVPLASLLVRRRHPLITIGVIAAGVVVAAVIRPPSVFEPLVMVAVYIAASRLGWRTSLVISALLYALITAATIATGEHSGPAAFVSVFVPIAGAYAVGVYIGTRTAYIDSLRARASQLQRERDLLAQQAVADERVRIARELHDVVAHHLSLITVQANALRTQVPRASPAATTADVIASTGHQAMEEMRRMLGVLRLGGASETPGRLPQPGIDDIDQLVSQTRTAGVETTLTVEGTRRPLPAAMELSAFRIVQEALTNVLRHAGPARCSVRLVYEDDALAIKVSDDGRGDSTGTGGGHGLVGMRERAALFGGTVEAGPAPGGGFAVAATLPLGHRDAWE
ncbi:MAG: sensor histidine kinase [Candidatus Dormibacteraeota bacterium]|nr:sensor histidine kinase [Candidatus Dormibacteraeota bacterium]